MGQELRITCDDGCGRQRTVPSDLVDTEIVHLTWWVPGGTEDRWFIKLSHAKRWAKDFLDSTPDAP